MAHAKKVQTFTDTRFGCSATLRVYPDKDRPFVLRCRTSAGICFFCGSYSTAQFAKHVLESMHDPLTGIRLNFWTVSGDVQDIE